VADCDGGERPSVAVGALESLDRKAGSAVASKNASEKANLYAVFASHNGVYAVELLTLRNEVEELRDASEIKRDLPDGLAGSELFLVGVSGQLFPAPAERSRDTEPNLYFSAVRDLDLDARLALIEWFNALHSGTQAFSRTRTGDERYRKQRIGWAASLRGLPFVQRVAIDPGVTTQLEMSYAKRTGPAESDVALGLDMNYRVTAKMDRNTLGLRIMVASFCTFHCTNHPSCPYARSPELEEHERSVAASSR
jgi:hypothetical protein